MFSPCFFVKLPNFVMNLPLCPPPAYSVVHILCLMVLFKIHVIMVLFKIHVKKQYTYTVQK